MSVPMKSALPLALVLAGVFAAQSAAQAPSRTTPVTGCPLDRDCDGVADGDDDYPDDPARSQSPENRPIDDPGKPKVKVVLPARALRTTTRFKAFSVTAENRKSDLVSFRVTITRTAKLKGKTVRQAFDQERKAWFTTANPFKYGANVNPKTKRYTRRIRLPGLVPGSYTVELGAMNNGGTTNGTKVTFGIR